MVAKARNGGGFTLIELLIVMTIIVLLVTILIPSLTNAIDYARSGVCLTTQNSINECYRAWSRAHGDLIPPIVHSDHATEYYDTQEQFDKLNKSDTNDYGGGRGTKFKYVAWEDLLMDYGLEATMGATRRGEKAPVCPIYRPSLGSSYAQNMYLGDYYGERSDYYNAFKNDPEKTESAVSFMDVGYPDRVPLLAEGPSRIGNRYGPGVDFNWDIGYREEVSNYWTGEGVSRDESYDMDGTLGQDIREFGDDFNLNSPTPHMADGMRMGITGLWNESEYCFYHGKASFLFCDGHSKLVSWDDNQFCKAYNGDLTNDRSYFYIFPDGEWEDDNEVHAQLP